MAENRDDAKRPMQQGRAFRLCRQAKESGYENDYDVAL